MYMLTLRSMAGDHLLILVFLILCCTASLASPATNNEYTRSPTLLIQQGETSTIPVDDNTAANHLLSSMSSTPTTTLSASVFAFPSNWLNSENDDSFHAARVAVEERKQQHRHPAPNNNEDNNNEMSSSTTKFPEVENNGAPEDPSSSTNTKVVGVIVGASVGGMVVVGAIALFVWQLHHRGGDDGILVNDPPFSPNTKSPDDEEKKIDMTTMIHQQPPLSPVSEATSSSSDTLDEKASLAQEDDSDSGPPTLDAFDQVGTQHQDNEDTHTVPCPDLISSVQSPSAPPRAARLGSKDEISSLVDMPKKKIPPVMRACPVIIENNASSSTLTFTHTRHASSSSTSPTTLSYPLKKLLHYPRCHMTQPPPSVSSPAPTTNSSTSEPYHLDRLFSLTPEQQQQQQRTRMNAAGMVTPFDLPPTEFLPLQNCPFPLVSRQSVMIDPSKRQGIHRVPSDQDEQ
ncbi:hypothetical protein K492DRAFT_233102 [Lichtheimia hyalospora FSU 10163]|nr:hypothetical protein K492DRAFT_233102 [Lichtheimia hyalospora FSU 10163]